MAEIQRACPHCKAILGIDVAVPAPTITAVKLVSAPPAPVQPPPPPIVNLTRKVPFGPYHFPIADFGKPGVVFNATSLTVSEPAKLLTYLNVARGKGSVLLLIPRSALKDTAGVLSVAAATAHLATWPDIGPYLADGTALGVQLGDDITAAEYGPVPMLDQPAADGKPAVMGRLSRWDAIGGAVRKRWPNATLTVRAKPDEIDDHAWVNLPVAWAVYRGPQRDGTPEAFRDVQVAAAKRMGAELVLWFNTLDGGDGSSGILGTYPDAAKFKRFQMSAAEVLRYGRVFLPHTKFALHWQWSPVYKRGDIPTAQLAGVQAFDTRPDVKASMAELRKLAG